MKRKCIYYIGFLGLFYLIDFMVFKVFLMIYCKYFLGYLILGKNFREVVLIVYFRDKIIGIFLIVFFWVEFLKYYVYYI